MSWKDDNHEYDEINPNLTTYLADLIPYQDNDRRHKNLPRNTPNAA